MPFWAWALILMVGSYIIQSALIKTPIPEAATLQDFNVPQVDEGTPHTVVFGDVWLEGWFVLWYGNYRTTKITSGGKK